MYVMSVCMYVMYLCIYVCSYLRYICMYVCNVCLYICMHDTKHVSIITISLPLQDVGPSSSPPFPPSSQSSSFHCVIIDWSLPRSPSSGHYPIGCFLCPFIVLYSAQRLCRLQILFILVRYMFLEFMFISCCPLGSFLFIFAFSSRTGESAFVKDFFFVRYNKEARNILLFSTKAFQTTSFSFYFQLYNTPQCVYTGSYLLTIHPV